MSSSKIVFYVVLCATCLWPPAQAEGLVGSSLSSRNATHKSERVSEYRRQIAQALAHAPHVLQLSGNINNAEREAQEIALSDARFLEGTRFSKTNAPLRNEILGVYALRESDMATEELRVCKTARRCYKVDQYQFAGNDTVTAFVDLSSRRVLSVRRLPNMQPEISSKLERLALELAAQSPLVHKALGRAPTLEEFVMATTKTALNRTRCERSQHLCVAPTIVEANTALFVVVDLTDLRVVGARWTKLGRAAAVPTEKRVQNETIARDYCDRATNVERDGWKFNFQITSSDGVRVADVSYKGQALYKSIKTVDWHVSYLWKDGMGYSDAVGCPVFSQAAVTAIDAPFYEPLIEHGQTVGFSFIQDFRSDQWPRPCNYFYRQRFDFYADGRLRPVAASFGRGCGDDGTYRPVTRVEFAEMTRVSSFADGAWKAWPSEDWKLASTLLAAADKSKLRFDSANGVAISVTPNDGGWEKSRGDNPYLYVTLHPSGRDEGASDLPPIGTCCNSDHRQGPEKFLIPREPITSQRTAPLVLWYVAQMKNDQRPGQEYCWADFVVQDGTYAPKAYPCYSGPLFRFTPPSHK
jgi:hypothetical protein